jgi:hypothetical protein
MSVPLPPWSKQQWAFFFRVFGENPCRHQKVLVSNLGLTVFVKHPVNWLNKFAACPQGKKKKTVKKQRPQGLLHFCPLPQQKPSDTLSSYKKYICLTGYIRGQKSTSSGVPIHASAGVLPLVMQALLVTLTELFLNYKPLAGKGEPGTWITGQTGKSK